MVCLDQQCQSLYTSQKPTINTPTVTSYNTLLDYSHTGARSSKTAKVHDPPNLTTGYSQVKVAWNKNRGCIKQFVCKMSADQLATGKYMKWMGFWASDRCPRCLQANKTTLHVIQCQDLSAMQLMVRLRNQLRSKLQQFPTQQATIDLIDHLLFSSSWNLQPQEQTNPVTQQLLQAQLQLPSANSVKNDWSTHGHNTKTST